MKQPLARPIPSSVRVFNIIELVQAIASQSTDGEKVLLSQVCRRAFEALIPSIWHTVGGVHILLGLITGTSFRYNSSTGEITEVILQKRSNRNQFVRFDIYAPFVKYLDVFPSCHMRSAFKISGWPLLTSRAQVRPLLPNLETLCIKSPDFPTREEDTVRWIRAFGCRATRRVLTCSDDYLWSGGDDWSISPTSASTILGMLVKRCPQLHTLVLSPRIHSSQSVGSRSRGSSHSPKPWYEFLKELPALWCITVGDGWLSRASLLALAQRPALESLVLYLEHFDGLGPSVDAPADFPDGSFPALRELSLKGVVSTTVLELLSLRKLVEPLTGLRLDHSAAIQEEDDWLTHRLFPLLEHMPHLKVLWITTNYEVPSTDTHHLRFIGTPRIMNIMAQLPLKTVDLQMMHLGTSLANFDLRVIWPNVTFLSLPSQYASLQELSYFAALPKLEFLNVRLDMTTTHTPKNIQRSNRALLEKLEGSQGSKLPKNFEVMTHNIRILQQLWPDAREAAWCNWDTREPLFSNLSRSFSMLLALHYIIGRYQAQKYQDHKYDTLISSLESRCEELRVKVDSGAKPREFSRC